MKAERRSDGLNVSYEYDSANNRTAIIWPDGWRAEYVYDQLNRLTEVKGGAPGSVATLARYTYDARGRRTQLAFGPTAGSPVSSIAYTWQPDSDLGSLTHSFTGASAVTFTHGYDASGRVTSASVTNAAWLWSSPVGPNSGAGPAPRSTPAKAGKIPRPDKSLAHARYRFSFRLSRAGVCQARWAFSALLLQKRET